MAIVRIEPQQVQVQVGWLDGRPRSIVLADRRVPVVSIAQVRDELAAYPIERGPRRIFDVQTPQQKLRVSFERRRRRWMLEALEAA